ncbi:MAG TPA: hypothetical protein VLT84_02110 [Acidobacteriota bacterium]|nr:hypothetical protein [Acidobacteriota bacterium]
MVGRLLGIAFAILVMAACGVAAVAADPVTSVSEPDSATGTPETAPLSEPPKTEVPAAEAPKPEPPEPEVPESEAPAVERPAPAPAPAAKQKVPAAYAATPGPSPSKNGADEAARVRKEIAATERFLAAVRNKVLRSRNRAARQDFIEASRTQIQSRESLEENLFARADRLTLDAREQARRIAVRLGPPQDDPDYVAMSLDQTDDALKRAGEILKDAGRPAERDRLASLTTAQKEARSLHGKGKTRASYEATRRVRDGVLTLLRDCDDLPVPPATAERALKRAVRTMEHAHAELGDKVVEPAATLERQARDQLGKARAAFARKNYRDTLLYAKLVERKLERAVAAQRESTSRSG